MKNFYRIIESKSSIFHSLKQPLDRLAIMLMLALSTLIGLLLLTGDTTAAQVRDFSWEGKQIGAEDTGFILTFNRPMDQASVEANLRVDPPLPGKFSWAGRRMAYTLMEPAPYGTTYSLQLQGAMGKWYGENRQGKVTPNQPFNGFFRSRDRAFIYIGVNGEEEGQLMLVNLTSSEPKPISLTPKDLVVMDFKLYPSGDRVLFSASDRSAMRSNNFNQELFTVTTGIDPHSPGEEVPVPQPAGKLNKVLDSQEYQNLKFDLSADGKIIVIQRVNRRNPSDYGPWILEDGEKPRRLDQPEGGDFLIRPDSKSMVISQRQGLAIVPLKPEADPVELLPRYEQVLALARDNSAAVYIKYNSDYTRSLFLKTNQGIEQEILRIAGSIINVQFDPRKTPDAPVARLYCLLAQRLKTADAKEHPYIAMIDLKEEEGKLVGRIRSLVFLQNQIDIHMSLSPDGLALLFDQSVIDNSKSPLQPDKPRSDSGAAIATSRLWLLPLVDLQMDASQPLLQAEELPFTGFNPRWLP